SRSRCLLAGKRSPSCGNGRPGPSASGAGKCKFLCQEMKRFSLCKRKGAPICNTRIRWAVVRLPDKFGVRRVLLVFPHYAPSFGTLEFSYPLTDGMCANMPPQGLLVIAAYLPASWEVRFIDENVRRATAEDFLWAEVVFVSGMHIQRRQI